ncbi:50S ribosomal protein L6 [Olsenella sp. YH-ols2221]|jgi:large subunit ribosomal protein L6|uniref:50S ribosomal protein L6 n=1 Tax=Olsenella TaxID=133925 RepID=UPI002A842290|nr:50S ribosomal protein L6 [Olsenella sp.]MDY3969822.1 50S ribosomal protein L6 [Atopobiaceae bacterium]MDD5845167.1 50S ribosomal protein L6 [Olsenella sp.]MDY4651777.1 50S ribosomal protein L6 [Atopobiaceae bacterium]MDY5003081.1 50S ribosomal protein L6 [Atopobiaceae bacterium]
MSRIGKKPVTVPAGVTVTINGNEVKVKGPKGELDRTFSDLVTISQEGEEILVARNDETTESNAQQGLTRTLIHNMVVGVSEGFEKKLELTGVGYRAQLKGKDLDLSLGYSHPVIYACPENISFEVPDNTHITVKGISKEQVGQVAAEVRAKRPPEPYKGKGIHYEGEHIRRKLGKAAK